MMRRLILLILLLSTFTLPALAQLRPAISFVRNGAFETDTDANAQPDSWGQIRVQTGVDGLICGKEAYAGCSYRFSSSGVSKWLVQGNRIYAPRNSTITVSAWVQSTSANARLAAVFYSNGSPLEVVSIPVTPSASWTQYTIKRQYSTFVDKVVIHLGQIGVGQSLFDSVTLTVE